MVNTTFKSFARLAIAAALLSGLATFAPPGFAAQGAAPYLTATRYNLSQQVTGVIRPSADGTARYPAVRNTYNSKGLLTVVEEGVLSAWQDETVAPADWPAAAFVVARKTVSAYDSQGRKLTDAVTRPDGSETDAAGLTQYGYDDLDRVACKTVRMNPNAYASLPDACMLGPEGNAGPDRITRYDYLIADLVSFEYRGVGTTLQQTYVENRYGAAGPYQLSDQLDANNNLTHYEYDTRGRMQRMYFPQKQVASVGSYNAADYEEYGYDLNGNRITLRKRDGNTITSNYDNLDRVWRKVLPNADAGPATVYHGYDLWGNQLYARFNSDTGPGITAVYNGFGELVSETSNTGGTSHTLSYQYDRNGNRTRVTHPDGSYFTYKYDQLDRLTDIHEGAATGLVLIHYSYDNLARPSGQVTAGQVASTLGYDAVSRPRTIGLDPAGTGYDLTHTLGYNPAGQIVTHELSNSNFQYLEKGSAAGAYLANGLNQYTQVGNQVFAYDDNGNLTSDGATTYGYDLENRLVRATGAKNASLKYDPLGHLYQVAGSSTTNFVYSGDALVAEYQNGVMTKRYVFGVGGDRPLVGYNGAAVNSASRQFLHGNHQGSVIAVTDGAGNVVSSNTYDAYGVPGAYNQGRFAYTGQTYLPEVGMYYYKARIYYPQIGRFLQTDPIGYKDDMDLYTYVHNDPLNQVDSTGLQSQGFWNDFKNGFFQGVSNASHSRGYPDVTDGTADKTSAGYLIGTGVGGAFVGNAAFGGRMPAGAGAHADAAVAGTSSGTAPRTGPHGVDPNHHNANVTIRDANGTIRVHDRVVSGNMTPAEKALGFPKGMMASHTEARAVKSNGLSAGETMTITGQLAPCTNCRGSMNRAATESGATIKYQWRENGFTQTWIATPRN